MSGGEIIIAFDMKRARGKIGSEPVKCSAINAKPRGQTSKILWSMVSNREGRDKKFYMSLWR